MDRKKIEAMVWRPTHREARGVGDDGVRRVLHVNPATCGTELWPLSSLTNAQLTDRLPRSVRDELSKIPSKGE